MAKWLAPAIVVVALAVAASVGAIVWAQQGGGGTCDRALVSATLTDGLRSADQRGAQQFDIERPAHCSEDDVASVLPEVTRNWHMMPGGTMMREPSHTTP